MKATIVEVAKQAGVSISMVSRVLSGNGYVRKDKREKVKKVIRKLGYHPSPLAKGLRDKRTRTVGLLFAWRPAPSFSDYFCREILAGVMDACFERNYKLLIHHLIPSQDAKENLYNCQEILSDTRLEGLLAVNPQNILVKGLKMAPYQVMLVGQHHKKLNFVDTDQKAGILQLVKLLVGKGNKRIAFLGGQRNADPTSELRYEIFEEALKKHKLAFDPQLVWEGDYSQHSGEEGARRLLKKKNPPTAFLAVTDHVAMGVIHAVNALTPGGRVDIVGIDDRPEAAQPEYSLTTLRQPFYLMGRTAAESMLQILEGKAQSPIQVELPMELIKRNSA